MRTRNSMGSPHLSRDYNRLRHRQAWSWGTAGVPFRLRIVPALLLCAGVVAMLARNGTITYAP